MTNYEFAEKALSIVKLKTLYVKGGFGAPLNASNKKRYSNSNAYNKSRSAKINKATYDTFAFDCCGLAKGILWGFSADTAKNYGGAVYASNGVPDISEAGFLAKSYNVSTAFKDIPVGACLYMKGHMGIYIGDGLAVEATPIWNDGVQISKVGGMNAKGTFPIRNWTSWGQIPYVDYVEKEDDDDMLTQEQFNDYMDNWLEAQKKKPADAYAVESLAMMKTKGLMVGDSTGNQMPQSFVKREDLAVILNGLFKG